MTHPKDRNLVFLKPWMEITGKLTETFLIDDYLCLVVDDKILAFRRESNEAIELLDREDSLIGKIIAILKTDIPDKPILIRTLS